MSTKAKTQMYELLLAQQRGLLEAEPDKLASLANSSALLNQTLSHTVFSGYYLLKGEELILGPFQGKVSCTRIALGDGVCGESAEKQTTMIVENVKTHQNYISCDSEALSEIVVPLIKEGKLLGVLDIDSSEVGNYDSIDQEYLEKYAELLVSVME